MTHSLDSPAPKQIRSISLSLFLCLLALYLISYAPTLHSSDGQAMFATAESLARRGAWDIEQIRWMDLQQGSYGLDGLLYSRKGLGQPLLALPLTWLGLIVPWFGPVTVTVLFGGLITALTAVFIGLILIRLGYTIRVGAMAGLIFGTATLAWPYAKTFFSDPLAGFLLLSTLLALILFSQTSQRKYAALAGLSLGWAVATRYAEGVFLPVYGLLFLAYLWPKFKRDGWQHVLPDLFTFSLPILAIGAGLMAFNLSRYGDPLNTGYLPQETFSAIWWRGIIGQLISPGRGILLYSPILIVTFFGLKPFWQKHKLEMTLCLAVILIHLLLYGKWFMWHGGFAWGPRFMIPTLPFWVLLMAPALEKLNRTEKRLRASWQFSFYLLWVISLVAQIPGWAIHFNLWQNRLLETGLPMFAPVTFFDPNYSPLFNSWLLLTIGNLNLAWVHNGQILWPLLLVLLLNLVVCSWGLRATFKGQVKPFIGLTTGATTIITLSYLLIQAHANQPPDLAEAVEVVNRFDAPLIYHEPTQAIAIAETYKGWHPVLGLQTLDANRLDQFSQQAPRLWWLSMYSNDIEAHLLQTYGLARQETIGPQQLHLLVRPDQPAQQLGLNFQNGITLEAVALSKNFYRNNPFAISLIWSTVSPVQQNYNVFIHLNNEVGETVAQADGQPQHAARPTTSWQPAESIADPHGLWLPDLPGGNYTLIAGLYDVATGERLLTDSGDHFVTLGVFVLAP